VWLQVQTKKNSSKAVKIILHHCVLVSQLGSE
jgi:hypothetical protein